MPNRDNTSSETHLHSKTPQPSDHLEPEWLSVSSASFAWRVAVWFTLLAAGALTASVSGAWTAACGIFLLGVAMAHGVELAHQALHHTGFRSRRLNELFGILLGLPMLVSFHEYRINHLKHHALLGTPDNREFFDYGSRTWTLGGIFSRFLMWHHYTSFCVRLVKAFLGAPLGDFHPRYQRSVRSFYFIAAAVLSALLVWCWAASTWHPLAIWLAALFLVASPLHAWIELPEHYGCNEHSTDVFQNTRTIKSNLFMTWLTNSNNYHVEHHLWSNVPIQKIHMLHMRSRGRALHFSMGYWQFYKSALLAGRNNATHANP